MHSFNFKHTAAAVALMFVAAIPAYADTETVTASVSSVGALVVTQQEPMNFGSYLFNIDTLALGNVEIVKPSTPGSPVVVTETGGATDAAVVGSLNTTPGEVRVSITGGGAAENGSVVHMRVADFTSTQFADTDVELSNLTYETITENTPTPIVADNTTLYNVTIVAGATPEPVYFGGEINIDGPITGVNTATFDVTIDY